MHDKIDRIVVFNLEYRLRSFHSKPFLVLRSVLIAYFVVVYLMLSSTAVNSFREILAHGAFGADFAAGFKTTLSQGIVLVTMNILLEFSPSLNLARFLSWSPSIRFSSIAHFVNSLNMFVSKPISR